MTLRGPGLIRSIRNLVEELTSFGRPELQRLKQESERLQEEIEAIKAVRERVRASEEALVLGQLRQAVTRLRGADTVVQEQKQAVTDAVDKLGEQAAQVQEAMLQQKALEDTQQLLSSIDVGKYVVEGVPLADCLKEAGNGDLQGQQRHESADKQTQRHDIDLKEGAQDHR